jgi:hypothetical protein
MPLFLSASTLPSARARCRNPSHGRARSPVPSRIGRRVPAPPTWLALSALWLAALCVGPAGAQPTGAANGNIYTCIDDRGRRLTADRPIAECIGKEQQVLNRDGSLRRIVPPTLTPEERAQQEARERQDAMVRAARAEAVRRDRNLLVRYADEPAHQRAREAALDTVRVAMRNTERRLADLSEERRPLQYEAEFYQGRTLPPQLRSRFDANDAATSAQRESAAQQQAELDRINRLFDIELERLRHLWNGAAPGSLGPLPSLPGAISSVAVPADRAQRVGHAAAGR